MSLMLVLRNAIRYRTPSVQRSRFFSAVTDAQRAHWESFLSTGRGTASLFVSIDADNDGRLSPSDVKRFIETVGSSHVLPRAFKILDERADDHPLNFHEFQDWLVLATQEEGERPIQLHYEKCPVIGDRANKQERKYSWNQNTMSQAIRRMQYAVRGEVIMKADKMATEGREIVYTNIGNPHAVGQKPITYYRQVLALCDLPAERGVDHPSVSLMFSADVVARARELRAIVGEAGTGAYTHSQGLKGIREHVAGFIEKRDGHPSYAGDIFLTNGASSGIEYILDTLIAHDTDAVMTPIPQYPIYSALITRLGGRKVGYELDEELGWAVTKEELEKRLQEANKNGLTVRALVLINPGNPTGQLMKRDDLEMICRFCAENAIVLLSDEVYQKNVYAPGKEFVSAKKVAVETRGCEKLELVSFHSTSKGLIGECGRRGGYFELHGIDPYVQAQLYKVASSGLCSGVPGQIMTSLMVKGPEEGEESYSTFAEEEQGIFDALSKKSKALVEGLNKVEGIKCQPAEAAMYAFPRLELPENAIKEAEAHDQTPDTLYALSLLEETGICVVPASGFGQKAGRIGFRTTFLPPENQLSMAIEKIALHHKHFCEKYS